MIVTEDYWAAEDAPTGIQEFIDYVADDDVETVDEDDMVDREGYADVYSDDGGAIFIHTGYHTPETDEKYGIGDWIVEFFVGVFPARGEIDVLYIGDNCDRRGEYEKWGESMTHKIVPLSEERTERFAETIDDTAIFEWADASDVFSETFDDGSDEEDDDE